MDKYLRDYDTKIYKASIAKLFKQYIKLQTVIMKQLEKVNTLKTKKAKINNLHKSMQNLLDLKNIQTTLLSTMDDSIESAEIQEQIMPTTTELENIIFAKDAELSGTQILTKSPKQKSTRQSKPTVITVNDFIKATPPKTDRPSLYEPKNTDEYDSEIHFNQVSHTPIITDYARFWNRINALSTTELSNELNRYGYRRPRGKKYDRQALLNTLSIYAPHIETLKDDIHRKTQIEQNKIKKEIREIYNPKPTRSELEDPLSVLSPRSQVKARNLLSKIVIPESVIQTLRENPDLFKPAQPTPPPPKKKRASRKKDGK